MPAFPLAITAKVAAAGRARESERPDRLFDDPQAAALAGAEGFAWMAEWRLPGMPEENPVIGPRTRFFDDLVVDAVTDGVRQVVLVAAGMDTRAFRLPLPTDVAVFELDRDELLAEKQAVLEAAGAVAPCRRFAVPVDLADRGWPQLLTANGFNAPRRAVFVAEGLSIYLTEEENAILLDDLASLAADESRLGVDMVSRDYLENPAVAPFPSSFQPEESNGSSGRTNPSGSSPHTDGPLAPRTSTPSAEGSAAGHRPA